MTMPKPGSHPQSRQYPALENRNDEKKLADVPSSPSKRLKVTFNTDVEILTADDDDDENFEIAVATEQVRRALQRHLLHDDDAYEKIRSIFNIPSDKAGAPSNKVLKIYLLAVSANISHLKRAGSLIHSLLNSEWIGHDESYFNLFSQFLGALAAAHTGFLNKVLQVLIDLLGPQRTRRLIDSKPVRPQEVYRRSSEAIRYITQLVPEASNALATRIVTRLDFEFAKPIDRITYVKNFIKLIKFVPELKSAVLTSVLRQVIRLDTGIQADLDDKEQDDIEDEILRNTSASQALATISVQDMLSDNSISDDDGTTTTDESDVEDETQSDHWTRIREDIKQVDTIMEILFQYYSKSMSAEPQTRCDTVDLLMTQFQSLILPTYRSRHPQFLVFHFAQGDPNITNRFISSCITRLTDKTQPQVLRHFAAAYLSGFISRSADISPAIVQTCISLLSDQLNRLRKIHENKCRGPDIKRYGDFYSIFQAIMYIFCFRWRDIGWPDTSGSAPDPDNGSDVTDNNEDDILKHSFPEPLRESLYAAIYSQLNPLRVCTRIIVEQFAKVAMVVRFMYIYPKIEENKRVKITRQSLAREMNINRVDRDLSWVGDNGMLEGYFPYDPYRLPISRYWIENDYVEWQGVPGEVNEGSSDKEDVSDIDDEDDDFFV